MDVVAQVAEETEMDPQAAWDEMLEAVSHRDWEQALERSGALLEWMGKGGFPPQTAGVPMRSQWNQAMAKFGCRMTLQLVKKAQKSKKQKG